jgi:hypothetical protein
VPPLSVETEQELCAYLDKQEQNGWPFDVDKAVALQGKLSARREELEGTLGHLQVLVQAGYEAGHVVTFTPSGTTEDLPSGPT